MGIIKKNLIDTDSPLKIVISNDQPVNTLESKEDSTESTISRSQKQLSEKMAEAQRLVDKANHDANTIIQGAQKKATELKEIAKEQGYQEGYDLGYDEGKSKYEALIKEIEAIKIKTQQKYKEYMSEAERDIVEVIMTVARKFIKRNISDSESEVFDLVKQTIESCSQREDIRLRVSAEDYQYLTANREKLINSISGLGDLKIIAEDNMEAGSCIVEAINGSVDSSVNTRLVRIEEAFIKALAAKTV